MKKIIVLGSINADFVTRVARTPQAGETVFGEDLLISAGGKGANQAVSIGKLGGCVTLLGALGDDENGKVLLKSLKANHVDTSHIMINKKEPTGVAIIAVNDDGDNTIIVISGANRHVKSNEYKALKNKAHFLLSQLELPINVVEEAFKVARKSGVCTVLNPAPAMQLPDALLRTTDILIPNEHEFKRITGSCIEDKHFEVAAKRLMSKGVKHLIITLGKKGVLLVNEQGIKKFAAHSVHAVDTTAAGDSFIGGLLYALSKNIDLENAIEFGIATSAVTVTRFGAQDALPTYNEVETQLKKRF